MITVVMLLLLLVMTRKAFLDVLVKVFVVMVLVDSFELNLMELFSLKMRMILTFEVVTTFAK